MALPCHERQLHSSSMMYAMKAARSSALFEGKSYGYGAGCSFTPVQASNGTGADHPPGGIIFLTGHYLHHERLWIERWYSAYREGRSRAGGPSRPQLHEFHPPHTTTL